MNDTTHHADHHFRVARRVEAISASSIFRINQRAQDLAGQGRDIVRLDAGEPDFDTPGHIIAAAKQALDDGYTRYTPIGGLPELKDAINNKFKRDNNLCYGEDEILVTCGAKQALWHPMDEAVIPTPHWAATRPWSRSQGADRPGL